jgi:hypothetical protein
VKNLNQRDRKLTIDVYFMLQVAVVNTIKELLDIHEKKPWSYIQKMESASLWAFYCGTITSKKKK